MIKKWKIVYCYVLIYVYKNMNYNYLYIYIIVCMYVFLLVKSYGREDWMVNFWVVMMINMLNSYILLIVYIYIF